MVIRSDLLRSAALWLLSLFSIPVSAVTYVHMETTLGVIDLELYEETAPLTVANFLAYLNSGRYEQTFIHRSDPGFVLQGGGYLFTESGASHITQDAPVVNEFSLSNTRGTIAMAKLGGDPDSATSEWFINLDDNSFSLDVTNGGYTVFGRVLGSGMDVVDAITALQVIYASPTFPELPVRDYSAGSLVTTDNLIFLSFPRVGLMPSAVAFGEVQPGAGVEADIRVVNQDAADLSITAVGDIDPVATPFSIVSDGCAGQTLSANGSCVLRVRYAPDAVGSDSESFNIHTDDPDSPNVHVQLSGVGDVPIQLTPSDGLYVGEALIGNSVAKDVTLTNDAAGAVSITAVSVSGVNADEFSQTNTCGMLLQTQSCTITVTFAPATNGSKTALVTVSTDAVSQAQIEIPVSADVPAPNIGVAGTRVDVGDVLVGDSGTKSLEFINGGSADLVISAMTISGVNESDFSISRNCTLLTPNQRCTETVTFAPTVSGQKTATLVIASNDPDTPAAQLPVLGVARDSWNRQELPTAGGNVILLTSVGTAIYDIDKNETLPEEELPPDLAFEQGFYEFSLTLPVGVETATVAISFPPGKVPNTFYKYGPTPDNAVPHWYEFLWDGNTGAVIQENVVTLYLRDGERGDSDLLRNGRIRDPGGPGYSLSSATTGQDPVASGGGGGGCTLSTGVRTPAGGAEWFLLGLILFLVRLHGRGSR